MSKPSDEFIGLDSRIPVEVATYLRNTGRLRVGNAAAVRSRIQAVAMYKDIFTNIGLLSGFLPEKLPALAIVYSPHRETNVVRLASNNYLIYDQYMGQTFNILNRVFQHAMGPRAAVMYGCKYLAEKLRLRGRLSLALMFALAYDELRKSHPLSLEDAIPRANMTYIQETFAFAHEFAHLEFSEHEEARSTFFLDAQRRAWNVWQKRVDHQEVNGRELNRKYGGSPEEFFLAQRQDAETERELLSDRTDIIEELACDSMAVITTQSFQHVSKGMEYSDVAEAIAMVLRHQRILDWLDLYVAALSRRDAKLMGDTSHETMFGYRISVNRRELPETIYVKVGDQQKIHERLIAMSNRYEEAIDDPILFNLRAFVANIVESFDEEDMDKKNRLLRLGGDWRAEIMNEIDELTGWVGS